MISPGMVDTELIKNLPPKLIELTAYQNPLKRIASPEDISELVLFLSLLKSDYINGVNIPVNGVQSIILKKLLFKIKNKIFDQWKYIYFELEIQSLKNYVDLKSNDIEFRLAKTLT